MDTPTCINVGGPVNALSRSPDGSHIIVAGRDVLKIISIKDSLRNVQSLRAAKMNLNFTGNDCAWHPMEAYKHTIATAAVNGAVVIWNISKEGPGRQERVISDHGRAVNRLSWHPENGQLLLSGSQDGTMKLWFQGSIRQILRLLDLLGLQVIAVSRPKVGLDTAFTGITGNSSNCTNGSMLPCSALLTLSQDFRDSNQNCCKQTFHGKAESVRDVQFSPHWTNYFAAAFDNGTVQIWDIRGKTGQYERKITAHQGLVLAVDWHPEDKSLLATGGRDRTVKVWDLNSKSAVPMHTIQTISSVSRIKWRPDHRFHIASCAGLMDFHVHIWDARKPYIPIGSLGKHRDVATGLLWTNKLQYLKNVRYSLLSCGKDSNLIMHDTVDAVRPVESIRTAAISWSIHNEMSMANDPLVRADVYDLFPSNIPAPPPPLPDKKRTAGSVSVFAPFGAFKDLGSLDSTVFQYLAQNYKLDGLPLADLCEHNSMIACQVQQHQLAQVWKLIKLFYEEIPKFEQNGFAFDEGNEVLFGLDFPTNPSDVIMGLQPSNVPSTVVDDVYDYDEALLAEGKSLDSDLLGYDADQLLSSVSYFI